MGRNSGGTQSAYARCGKRAVDVLGSIVALPVIVPVACVVGVLIKMEDAGPVLYKGPRRGKDGRAFTIYKFRSMKVDAPDLRNVDGSTVNGENDDRITAVGRILRKTSIDELPQILNVLRGDMSFVGPRPDMLTRPWDQLSEIEKKRLKVRPGITGLAQALYRNSIPAAEKRQIDSAYVDAVSMTLDIKVLFKTVSTVVTTKGIDTSQVRQESK